MSVLHVWLAALSPRCHKLFRWVFTMTTWKQQLHIAPCLMDSSLTPYKISSAQHDPIFPFFFFFFLHGLSWHPNRVNNLLIFSTQNHSQFTVLCLFNSSLWFCNLSPWKQLNGHGKTHYIWAQAFIFISLQRVCNYCLLVLRLTSGFLFLCLPGKVRGSLPHITSHLRQVSTRRYSGERVRSSKNNKGFFY